MFLSLLYPEDYEEFECSNSVPIHKLISDQLVCDAGWPRITSLSSYCGLLQTKGAETGAQIDVSDPKRVAQTNHSSSHI